MYDVVVIGGGWAGINAAITASNLGLKTALVEKDKIGGLCLNYGCIPTKVYFQSAKLIHQIRKSKEFGINTKDFSINFSDIFKRKEKIIENIAQGLKYQLKNIDLFYSNAEIKSCSEIIIDGKILKTKNLILATGSMPKELNNLEFDGKKILSSTDILNLEVLPKNLLIIGAGAIGCEFAWIFSNFGINVTLIEVKSYILPELDIEISKKVGLEFKKIGIDIITSCDFSKINIDNFEKVLVTIGRMPNLDSDWLSFVKEPNIYLAGDVNGKLLLAHAASKEGKTCATNIYNLQNNIREESINYNLIPNSIFVYPEIAAVGVTSGKAKTFSLKANGICNILGETGGIIKLFIEDKTDKILGGVLYCPNAFEIVNILVTAINSNLDLNKFKKLAFTHPSVSESLLEV
ncbi:MAG: NAD(P)/FAD-dependent oxidoreductase [Candidatus Omnitrophota bacterium]